MPAVVSEDAFRFAYTSEGAFFLAAPYASNFDHSIRLQVNWSSRTAGNVPQ